MVIASRAKVITTIKAEADITINLQELGGCRGRINKVINKVIGTSFIVKAT